MRDLSPLRHRLLAAMGLAASASTALPGCVATAKSVPAAASSSQDSGALTAQDAADGTADAAADVTTATSQDVAIDLGFAASDTVNPAKDSAVDAALVDADSLAEDVSLAVNATADVGFAAGDSTDEANDPDGEGALSDADSLAEEVSFAVDATADVIPAGLPAAPTNCWGTPTVECQDVAELQANFPNPCAGYSPDECKYTPPPVPPAGCPALKYIESSSNCYTVFSPVVLSGATCCFWSCDLYGCGPGRPWIVDGGARTAELAAGTAWQGDASPLASDLTPEHASALAAAWRADALAEHASIASFQRFGLELLAIGAPDDLVEAAVAATADEIRHARAAFAIASALDGQRIGPGRLAVADVRLRDDLATMAAAAVTEGCIGETLASARAAAAARQCREPRIAAILRQIADDEARHAELAWKFVAWAIRTGDDAVRAAVATAFRRGITDAPAMDPRDRQLAGVPDPIRLEYGQFGAGQAVRLDDSVRQQVVRPCAVALLGAADLPECSKARDAA